MKPLSISLILLGLTGSGCGDDLNRGLLVAGSVEGSVVEISSNSPVVGAELILIDPGRVTPASSLVRTDRNGRYRIDGVPPGDYAVFVYHDTLITFDRSAPLVRVAEGEVSTYQIRMMDSALWDGSGYRVAGTVLDDETGLPVDGAFVEGVFEAWNDIRPPFQGITRPDWAVTDPAGRFSITVRTYLVGGELVGLEPISVTRDGYESYSLGGEGPWPEEYPPSLPIPTGSDSTLHVEVRLTPLPASGIGPHGAGTVRGRITCLGAPVAGIRVAVSMLSSAHPETLRTAPLGSTVPIQGNVAVTDSEGRFQIGRLTPGLYALHPAYLSDDGYLHPESSTLRVDASRTTDTPEIELIQAIRPVDPPRRAVVTTTAPRFSWEEKPGRPDYVFREYRLHVWAGSVEYVTAGGLSEPSWQLPDSLAFPAGMNVRWSVDVIGLSDDSDLPETVAAFETSATFTVHP